MPPFAYDTKLQRQGITVISRQPSIQILSAEVRKLKAIADFNQAEAEENAIYEIEAIREKIDNHRFVLGAAKNALRKIRVEVEANEECIRYNEKCYTEMEVALKKTEEERLQMVRVLQDMKLEQMEQKAKGERSEEMLKVLVQSMGDLQRDQEKMVEYTKRTEHEISKEFDWKMKFLKTLMAEELEMKRKSEQKPTFVYTRLDVNDK
jgi:chromosome segregation ATPase